MATDRKGLRTVAVVGSFAAILLGFFLFVRPWYIRWGATDEETRRRLPGDEIVESADRQETSAITIRAPIEQVWPWLAQLGQDRGGFYSFDLLENLVGCEMPTTDRLWPDKQSWQLGDKFWMYPKNKAGGIGYATLRTFLPGGALGFGIHALGTVPSAPEDGSWSFILDRVDNSHTRLLVRGRGAPGRSLLGLAFDRSIFEPVHFVMERRMMIGLKEDAEGSDRHHLVNHVHVVLWTIAFGQIITAIVMVMRQRHWAQPLAGMIVAAVVFQILTLGQPPIAMGVALLAALGAIMWWPVGRGDGGRRDKESPRLKRGR